MKTKTSLIAICIGAVLLSLDCSSPTQTTGNGSGSGNAVVGKIYSPGGTAPAKGIKVTIRPKMSLPDTSGIGMAKRQADTASVVTDDAGRFAFDTSLAAGAYVIEAKSGNDAVLIDSVVVNKTTTDTLPPDTLKPAGAIKGVIKLSEGGDPRKVFVMAFGIDRFTAVGEDGSFKFKNMAESAYDLRIISVLDDYGVFDMSNVAVTAAETTDVKTIELPFTGIPTPKNVAIAYDTMKQIVTLSWNKADFAIVKGFNVYRRNVDSNSVLDRINTNPITDTLYRDSTGIQDQTYEYHVAALDKNATEGTKSTVVSTVIATYFHVDSIYGGEGSALGMFNNPTDIAVANNGDIYIVDRGNKRIQVFGKNMQPKFQFSTDPVLSPFKITLDSSRNAYVIDCCNKISVFDTAGLIKDSLIIGTDIFDIDIASNTLFTIQKDSIISYDFDGNHSKAWGGNGTAVGQYSSAEWIVSGGSDELYISDADNHRVQVCDSLGINLLTSIETPSYQTSSIAVDSINSRLYVNYKPSEGNRLRVFNKQMNIIADYKYGSYNNLLEPLSIGISQDGSLLVVLTSSNIIVKLRPLF